MHGWRCVGDFCANWLMWTTGLERLSVGISFSLLFFPFWKWRLQTLELSGRHFFPIFVNHFLSRVLLQSGRRKNERSRYDLLWYSTSKCLAEIQRQTSYMFSWSNMATTSSVGARGCHALRKPCASTAIRLAYWCTNSSPPFASVWRRSVFLRSNLVHLSNWLTQVGNFPYILYGAPSDLALVRDVIMQVGHWSAFVSFQFR